MKKHELIQAVLERAGIPHYELKVFGLQIKVITLTQENLARWRLKLETIANIQSVEACTVRAKKAPGNFHRPAPVEGFKIIAILKDAMS